MHTNWSSELKDFIFCKNVLIQLCLSTLIAIASLFLISRGLEGYHLFKLIPLMTLGIVLVFTIADFSYEVLKWGNVYAIIFLLACYAFFR